MRQEQILIGLFHVMTYHYPHYRVSLSHRSGGYYLGILAAVRRTIDRLNCEEQ